MDFQIFPTWSSALLYMIQFEFMYKKKYHWRLLGKINLLNTGIQIESTIANEMINYREWTGAEDDITGGGGGGRGRFL